MSLVERVERNFREKFSFFQRQMPNMMVTREYGPLLIDSELKTDMFNVICATGSETPSSVTASLAHFRKKELPFCWWVGFAEDPPWLAEELRKQGLRPSEDEWVMVAEEKDVKWPSSPEGFQIKHIDAPGEIADFLHVVSEIVPSEEAEAIATFYTSVEPFFLRPDSPRHFFVGYLEEKPVATTSLFCAEGMASIFDVVVSPSERGRGLGKRITAAGMEAAATKGYTLFALSATNDAKYLYEKLGFSQIKALKVYA